MSGTTTYLWELKEELKRLNRLKQAELRLKYGDKQYNDMMAKLLDEGCIIRD